MSFSSNVAALVADGDINLANFPREYLARFNQAVIVPSGLKLQDVLQRLEDDGVCTLSRHHEPGKPPVVFVGPNSNTATLRNGHGMMGLVGMGMTGLRSGFGGKGNYTTVEEVTSRVTYGNRSSSVSTTTTTTTVYTEFAGRTKITCPLREDDRFGNAQGNKYDLGQDGAFRGSTIAVLQQYTTDSFDFALPEAALKDKGFSLRRWTSTPSSDELRRALSECSQLWLISGSKAALADEHILLIEQAWLDGLGVYIWGDNDPFFVDANRLLGRMMPGVSLSGNVPGQQLIEEKKDGPSSPGFTEHLITTGIERLYEGNTVATIGFQPEMARAAGVALIPVAHGSAGNLLVGAQEQRKGKGRLLVDGAFTRLYCEWDTAGSARYVKNAACWLDNRDGKGHGGAGKGGGAHGKGSGKGSGVHGKGSGKGSGVHGKGSGVHGKGSSGVHGKGIGKGSGVHGKGTKGTGKGVGKGKGSRKICPKYGVACKFGDECRHY